MKITRRDMMVGSAATLSIASMGMIPSPSMAADKKDRFSRALIGGANAKTLEAFKAAGFAGIETQAWSASPEEAAKGREIAESLGMKIHSVMRGWCNFNTGSIDNDIASVQTALRAAAAYGADAILLVPCRTGVKGPQPWEFDIDFDPKTCEVTSVVKGDNSPYEAYIAAQNQANDATRKALEKCIPLAEELGVTIALENVWNNLWVKPKLFAAFVRSFKHPRVQSYYDIGNHVKYAPPVQWIEALSDTIVKIHVKDFKLNEDGHGGRFCTIGEGDADWPAVSAALDKIGYRGWITIEGGGLPTDKLAERLAEILPPQS